jgi:hypothetical protein
MEKLRKFLKDESISPILAALAAGLYPILFYYTNNYTLINSWDHLGYFITIFLVLPMIIFSVAFRVSKLKMFHKWQKYVLPFLNLFVFLFLLKVCLYAGLQKKMTLGIIIVTFLVVWFFYRFFKKWVVVQFVLAVIGAFTLIPVVISQLNYSREWLKQPDDIENAVFKKKPNVYLIQPDGYVNFSELKKGYYNIDNSEFESFLATNNFKNYPEFRNNYASTLSSNSATFMMKHHHYNKGSNFSEGINAREIIISKNSVLSVFKKNGYKTHYISEKPYLLVNRPKMGYDYCNFSYDEIPYLSTGFIDQRDIFEPLSEYIEQNPNELKFVFIEFFNPGHIANRKVATLGKEKEKEAWVESLERANDTLEKLVSEIKAKDPNSLILIMADHGGYVGMDYAQETETKTQDRDLIYSMFSSQLSIHWPDGKAPKIDANIKSAVNVFRVLISYLSETEVYLEHLQDNSSYIIINDGAPKGVYKYIDNEGKITFLKH